MFSELQASRYRFMAYFGEEAARPFEEIRAIHSEVIDSAHNLIRTYGQEPTGSEEARRNQWEAAIGWGEGDGDTQEAARSGGEGHRADLPSPDRGAP